MFLKVGKDLKVALFVIFCILLNLTGKFFASYFQLPFWLDSFGTVISAYSLGPFCGAVIGLTMNVLYSSNNPISYAYSLTSISIALIVGICGRKKYFNSFYGTACATFLVTFFSVIISVTVSWVYAKGMTGNLWGDGVIRFLEEQGFPIFLSSIAGQFYIDFLDKTITLLFLYLTIKIWRKRNKIERQTKINIKKISKKIHFTPVLVLFLIFTANQNADSENSYHGFNSYVQTIYSSSTGLPCGEANDIVQTSDGILWIGTYAGLYRYNGSEFKWMNEYEKVRSVNCLYADEEGRLWIGTNDNGLSICINEKIVNTLDSDEGLISNSVRAIVKGSDGYYYIGTSTGILVLELNSGLRVCNIIKDPGYIVSLSADSTGFVSAVSSRGELFILNETEVRYSQKLNAAKEIYTACAFDEDGYLYAGTSSNRIFKYEITEEEAGLINTFECDSLHTLNKIYFEGERIFVCADNGIGYLDKNQEFTKINTGSFNNSIDNMTIDYQGNYWFTSSRQGLLRLSASSFVNLYSSLGIKESVVNSVQEWNGVLYAGTDKGLDAIKDNRQIKNRFTALFSDTNSIRIRCLKKDSKNNLWVCTYGNGLFCLNENGTSAVYNSSLGIGNRIRVCIEMQDGTIAASSNLGISFIKDGKVINTVTRNDGLTNSMILSLLEAKNGTILAGSDGDGLVVIRKGKVEQILGLKDGLTSGVILRTVPEPNGKGYFIVTSNSLCYMNTEFKIYPLKNFPYFNNYDIWTNKNGRLFVLGSAGIYVVETESLLTGKGILQYDLLDSKSGLNSALTANAWNYCDEFENLYLSCGTGVYVVNMNDYISGKRSYRMMVSSVRIDSVKFPIERSEPLMVNRNTSKIEFFPEVVNYTVLDPLVSYWLEGFDAKEIIIPQSALTSVTYTNLPSGNYKFHLAVLDKDQNVIEKNTYEIIKEKDINDTQYFKFYLLLVMAIFVAWVTWFFVRRQVKTRLDIQKKELEFAKEQVRMGNETILAIAKTVDAKDENTSQHSMRVSEYSVMIAKELGFNDDECENLRKAALLHDIGKIGIPDRILNKPGRLDDSEYAVMKTHVVRGAEILKDFTMIEHVSDGARYHHERWDGTGYAQGLKGEEIPLYARIIGMADAFDAMTANRVYRKQLDFDFVLEEIKRCSGSQFDPKIAGIMLALIENKKIDIDSLYKNFKKSGE
ncbi:HD domain-containing phosphohydrolase [Treponema sp.]|uniref:HD domain-containing phosphohydrolase n=1 Tax=Treponema sp. TaxID=166 RepID=UPI00388D8872